MHRSTTRGPGVRARLRNAGHILGSAFVELEVDARPRPVRMVFSGDIGPLEKALQPDAEAPAPADVAVIESTYGDRVRPRVDEAGRRSILARELADALKAGGNVIVPAFAVERTQEILDDIAAIKRSGELGPVQVFSTRRSPGARQRRLSVTVTRSRDRRTARPSRSATSG
jgi:metallo-beta-lactamase family protein